MTTGYGISGIGYPLTGLGNYGLSPMSQYASYDNYMYAMNGMGGMVNPSLLGMNAGYGTNAGYGMNPMAYGMYNPIFMGQLMSQMEQNQLAHANIMHQNMLNYEVQATTDTDRALVSKMLTNASVQRGIDNLRQKVLEGDQDGICNEFDALREQIYRTYKDELTARGSEENPYTAAARLIENLYGSIVSAQTGQTANLRADIQRYGNGAGATGFMQGFSSGHHDRYVDETLYHCFGLDIDNRGSKDFTQSACRVGGRAASALEKGLIGGGIGAAGYGLTVGASKAAKLFGGNGLKFNAKHMGRVGIIAGIACLIGDIIWKCTDNKATA